MKKGSKFNIFSRNKEGHHKNLEQIFVQITLGKVKKSIKEQMHVLFHGTTIVFLDADQVHLVYLPAIIIRNMFGYRNVLVSVRTDRLLRNELKWVIRRFIFQFLKRLKNVKIASYMKFMKNKDIDKCVDDYFYDPQYWDLPWLNINSEKPPELFDFHTDKPILWIPGLTKKRSKLELLTELRQNQTLNYLLIISGEMSDQNYLFLSSHPDCFIIKRYLKDEELLYLHNLADVTYCYYDSEYSNRTSGFIGRAMQLGKHSLVRENSYLHRYNKSYDGLIPVSNLSIFNYKIKNFKFKPIKPQYLEDETSLRRILFDFR